MKYVIVSRHPAAIEFIRSMPEFAEAPVISGNATAEDIRNAVVAGNLPLHLASIAAEVWALEFKNAPPRGQEYTAEDMVSAGAVLRRYQVAYCGEWDGEGSPYRTKVRYPEHENRIRVLYECESREGFIGALFSDGANRDTAEEALKLCHVGRFDKAAEHAHMGGWL